MSRGGSRLGAVQAEGKLHRRLDARRRARESILDRTYCSSWNWSRDGQQTASSGGFRRLERYSVRLEYDCNGGGTAPPAATSAASGSGSTARWAATGARSSSCGQDGWLPQVPAVGVCQRVRGGLRPFLACPAEGGAEARSGLRQTRSGCTKPHTTGSLIGFTRAKRSATYARESRRPSPEEGSHPYSSAAEACYKAEGGLKCAVNLRESNLPSIEGSHRDMPTTETPMRGLLRKLDTAGIPPSFAKKMLPSWWEDDVAADPAGLQQAQLYLARAFNIEFRSLAEDGQPPRFRASARKYKLSKAVTEEVVSASANYVTGVARVALSAMSREQQAVPSDPAALRKEILQNHDCVSLSALLEWCRDAGIPVLHIDAVPGKKMTGLVVRDGGRFAIVLSKKGHPAHLLFHLAHELGHIGKGHLKEDGFVADEKIDSKSSDKDELEADQYAVCLLNGANLRYGAKDGRQALNAAALHLAAVSVGKKNKVDPGHIIANYGFHQDRFPVAALALKRLDGPAQGGTVINDMFFASLDRDLVSDDQLELLKTSTGIRT